MRGFALSLILGVLGCSKAQTKTIESPQETASKHSVEIQVAPNAPREVFVDADHLDQVRAPDEPLVVVFFATWCELCAHKVRTVEHATTEVGGAKVVFVAVDDEDTKDHIPGFLREQRMPEAPVIDGLANPQLLARLNPTSSIPLVLVVGDEGQLVDAQVGLQSGDGQRLEDSLRAAAAGSSGASHAFLDPLPPQELRIPPPLRVTRGRIVRGLRSRVPRSSSPASAR